MKEKTKFFTAGLVDAEGCIRISKQKQRNGSYFYSPRVYITNQSRRLMKWLVLHFGGQFVRNKNSNPGEDWYLWYIQSQESVPAFLNLIRPCLRIKKAQANELLSFCKEYSNLTPTDKEEYFLKLKEMKKNIGSVTTETPNGYKKFQQAYLAGFFDGEGCVDISPKKAKNSIGYTFDIKVTNQHVPTLEEYKTLFGGRVAPKDPPDFHWYRSGKKQIELALLAMLPYLVVKRDEALLGVEYARLPWHKPCPEKRKRFVEKLRELKKSKIQSDLDGDIENAEEEILRAINNETTSVPPFQT